jgi:hypothetical protein
MAKLSVAGVEVVDDAALVDWARAKNKPPLMTGINSTTREETLGGGNFYTLYLEDDGTGKLRLVRRRPTGFNCSY